MGLYFAILRRWVGLAGPAHEEHHWQKSGRGVKAHFESSVFVFASVPLLVLPLPRRLGLEGRRGLQSPRGRELPICPGSVLPSEWTARAAWITMSQSPGSALLTFRCFGRCGLRNPVRTVPGKPRNGRGSKARASPSPFCGPEGRRALRRGSTWRRRGDWGAEGYELMTTPAWLWAVWLQSGLGYFICRMACTRERAGGGIHTDLRGAGVGEGKGGEGRGGPAGLGASASAARTRFCEACRHPPQRPHAPASTRSAWRWRGHYRN